MPKHAVRGLFAVWLLILWATAHAAIPSIPAEGTVTVEQIAAAIEAVDARTDLDEETKGQVAALLRESETHVRNKLADEAAAAGFAASLENAPAETDELRARLNEPAPAAPTLEELGIKPDMPVTELDQVLARELAELSSKEARLAELEAQVTAQENRPTRIRERINSLRASREEVAAAIEAPAPAGEPEIQTDARKLAARLKQDAQAAEMARLEQELLSHDARLNLVKARRDVAARELSYDLQFADALQQQVNEARQSAATQAQQSAALAELAAADKHPVVLGLAQYNAELTSRLPELAADIERVTQQLTEVYNAARDVEQDLARSKQRFEIGGVNQVIGQLFVEERENLPKVSVFRAQVRERESILAEVGLAQVRIEEQRRDITRIDVAVDEAMADVAESVTDEAQLASIRVEVETLLRDRRELLRQVGDTYTSYIRALGDLDVAQRRLLDVAVDYKEFLDRHLLWIPSAPIVGLQTIKDVPEALAWALSPPSWAGAVEVFFNSVRERPLTAISALLLLLLAFLSRRPLRARYKKLNGKIGRLASDNIGLTIGAMAIAAVRALPVPLAFLIVGRAIEIGPGANDFTNAVAFSFHGVVPFFYNLLLYRALCARQGVMQVHFLWSEESLAVIRRQLTRLIIVGVPLVFFTILLYSSPNAADRESLARIGFVVLMAILSRSLHPIVHPRDGVAAAFYKRSSSSWVSRLRWLWYAIAVGGPVLLGLASLVGYLYTATMLLGHLVDTFWLVLGIIVVNLVVLRWLALARRKLAWQRLQEEREARLAEKAAEADEETVDEVPAVASTPLDLESVDQQTRRLLHAGLLVAGTLATWGIWSDVIPALGIFEQVSVWSRTTMVDGVQALAPVTLADLLLALIVIAITIVASRNLPGLTEIALLQHLDLESGSRYTINTLLRYVVVTVGVIAVLNIIGLNWSRIQWLVAALSVGIGFGLQQIVANFFSGLIILFERPVRVGDTVTVGQLTGTVSRVRIRATTITDWDRKEIIVPNESFISQQVINWTLSDPITRIVVPVGISYGSDVQLATRVMLDTLNEMPLVLDEPAPMVYFMGFGDSSLDFNLYVYSRQLADRLPLMHAVHEEILSALRKSGIEIPFPQRDLHVKSVADDVKDVARRQDSENGD